MTRKHSHYFKDVSHLREVDIYRILRLYNVTDQNIGHAIKKLLVAGGRGADKNVEQDINEAIDSLARYLQMQAEDCNAGSDTTAPEITDDMIDLVRRLTGHRTPKAKELLERHKGNVMEVLRETGAV